MASAENDYLNRKGGDGKERIFAPGDFNMECLYK
jgi:hypothetical protein